jgi:hypothetical protein
VPASIPDVECKVMVKPAAFADPCLTGSEDPFLRLIPVAVSHALQQYEERKLNCTRTELDNVDDHNNYVKRLNKHSMQPARLDGVKYHVFQFAYTLPTNDWQLRGL